MGRLAHLLRLTLGRSADLPPDWAALEGRFHEVQESRDVIKSLDSSIGDSKYYRLSRAASDEAASRLTFDEKGRPFDIEIRLRDCSACEAQNDLLRLAVTNVHGFSQSRHGNDAEAESRLSKPCNDDAESVLSLNTSALTELELFDFTSIAFYGWLHSLRKRLLLLKSPKEASLLQLLLHDWRSTSKAQFFLAGVPTFMITSIAVFDAFLELIPTLPSRLLKSRGPAIRTLEKNLSAFMHLAILSSFIPLRVIGQIQQLRIHQSSPLLPSLQLFKSSLTPFMILRGVLFTIVPAFALQFIDSQIYKSMHGLISTYVQAYVLKPANINTGFDKIDELNSLFKYSDSTDAREKCFEGWLGTILPRRSYSIISRANDILTSSIGWNGRRSAQYNASHSTMFLTWGVSQTVPSPRPSRTNNDILSNRPGDIAASQLAHILTFMLTSSVEGIFVRTFTWLIVDTSWTPFYFPNYAPLNSEKYSLLPNRVDLSIGGISEAAGYVSKIGVCLGIESCMRLIMVACVSGYTIWRGKRDYGWGTGFFLIPA